MRWSITGTTASTSARFSWTARSVPSGSKRRRSTIVEAVGRLITKWKKPQEWKSGAAIIIVSRLRKGILSISAAIASSPSGLERWAPFGVPVVPEVRMTKRGLSGGGLQVGLVAGGDQLLQRRLAGLLAVVDPADDAGDASRRRPRAGRRTPSRRRAPSAPRAGSPRPAAGRRTSCSGRARWRRAWRRPGSPR